MKVKFSPHTRDDFGKYKDYLQKLKKSNTDKYRHIKPEEEKKKLRDNIGSSIGNKDDHSDSIFPKEFDYSSDSHKMYIDKKSHHVIFYKVVKTKKGEPYISIEKCIHSQELRKELEKKEIEPLEDSDPKLLLDYITIEKEDKVNDETLTDDEREEYKKKEEELKERISNKSKKTEKKEEVTDPKTGKKIKKVKHTGPRGGHYYINDNGEHIYPEEWNESIKNMKSVKSYITESKMVSLVDYLKKMVG